MAIPQGTYDSSSKLKQKKQYLVKKKPLKKTSPFVVRSRVKKEDIGDVKPKIWKTDSNAPKVHLARGKASSSALAVANEVQTKLPSEFPSVVKLMLQSHVTGGYWLSLPKKFCDSYLPKNDASIFLVDENNEEYYTKYLIEKQGLSAGWRGFSIAHNLLVGDAVVFQLIKPCRMKVYIVRADSLSEIDGAVSLLNLESESRKFTESNPSSTDQEGIANSENVPTLDAQSGKGSDLVPDHNVPNTSSTIEEAIANSKNVPTFDAHSGKVSDLVPAHNVPNRSSTIQKAIVNSDNVPTLDAHSGTGSDLVPADNVPNTSSILQVAIANSDNVPTLDAQSGKGSDLMPAPNHLSGNGIEFVQALCHQPGNENDVFFLGSCSGSGSEILDGIRFSESVTDFKDMKVNGSFTVSVEGLVLDSEIPKHHRIKYYDLCSSQNSFLHDHLIKGLNCKLAAGIISETVNIADAIRASKLNTSSKLLQTWDLTLKAFEDMGMTVRFLRDRIKKLVCFQREEQEINSKTLVREQVKIDKKKLEAELSKVNEVIKVLDTEIENLKVKNERLVLTFKEVAAAPW